MNRRRWNLAIGLAWLALPAVALRYWLVWDRLPASLATHFNAAGRANGWMSRETSLIFTLGLMVLLLALFAAVLTRVRKPEADAWALLGMFYVIVGTVVWTNESLIAYNLYRQPVAVGPVLIVIFLSVFAVLAVFLVSKRGSSFTGAPVIAEEVHAVPAWAVVFLVPLFIELAALVAIPNLGVRIGMGLAVLLFLLIAAGAWSGFHYLFSNSGVEIRTLGFRLHSIPVGQIKEYAVSRWNPLGGYGIRGVSGCRAYVWGNKGVRIKTADGEIFLGHREPERIVRDLDAIKQFAH